MTTRRTEVDAALRLDPPHEALACRRGLPAADGAFATAEPALQGERR